MGWVWKKEQRKSRVMSVLLSGLAAWMAIIFRERQSESQRRSTSSFWRVWVMVQKERFYINLAIPVRHPNEEVQEAVSMLGEVEIGESPAYRILLTVPRRSMREEWSREALQDLIRRHSIPNCPTEGEGQQRTQSGSSRRGSRPNRST